MYETTERCTDCKATLVAYEVYDIETGEETGEVEVVCPNEWMEAHE